MISWRLFYVSRPYALTWEEKSLEDSDASPGQNIKKVEQYF